MNQDLPIRVETVEEKGTITYATEVIATIVGVATTEVEGISSMAGAATISERLGGKPKNLSRGVKVEVGAEEVAVDVSVIVDYGMPIQVVARSVQENIRKSIETMTGLHVIHVDVHVLGVSFEKENKELAQGQEMARLQSAGEEAFRAPRRDEEPAQPQEVVPVEPENVATEAAPEPAKKPAKETKPPKAAKEPAPKGEKPAQKGRPPKKRTAEPTNAEEVPTGADAPQNDA